MLNNNAIKITDIKPTIPRYQVHWFHTLQLTPTGDWVRYCDHTQALVTEKALYGKAKEQVDVMRERMERMTTVKDNYHKQALRKEFDNVALRRQLNKLEWTIPLLITACVVISVWATFLLTR